VCSWRTPLPRGLPLGAWWDGERLVPRPRGVEKLAGVEELYRVRVGTYRIVYAIRERELVVVIARVGHRRDVYR
jgi:mRNA-degrading endonuclease RelE of RelBE toxin-antitoxin system